VRRRLGVDHQRVSRLPRFVRRRRVRRQRLQRFVRVVFGRGLVVQWGRSVRLSGRCADLQRALLPGLDVLLRQSLLPGRLPHVAVRRLPDVNRISRTREVIFEPAREFGPRACRFGVFGDAPFDKVGWREARRTDRLDQITHASNGLEPRLDRTAFAPVSFVQPTLERSTRARTLGVDRTRAVRLERRARLLERRAARDDTQPVLPRRHDLVALDRHATEERSVAAESARLTKRCEGVVHGVRS
jgi:hypothetical protein